MGAHAATVKSQASLPPRLTAPPNQMISLSNDVELAVHSASFFINSNLLSLSAAPPGAGGRPCRRGLRPVRYINAVHAVHGVAAGADARTLARALQHLVRPRHSQSHAEPASRNTNNGCYEMQVPRRHSAAILDLALAHAYQQQHPSSLFLTIHQQGPFLRATGTSNVNQPCSNSNQPRAGGRWALPWRWALPGPS